MGKVYFAYFWHEIWNQDTINKDNDFRRINFFYFVYQSFGESLEIMLMNAFFCTFNVKLFISRNENEIIYPNTRFDLKDLLYRFSRLQLQWKYFFYKYYKHVEVMMKIVMIQLR